MSVALNIEAMSDQAFRQIAKIAITDAGLAIPMAKKALVQSRISRRLRELGLKSINDYLQIVDDETQIGERKELISILTTNVSGFFREEHHFRHMVENLFPVLREKIRRNQKIRIWSCGCSSGQEPYTIAMEILKYFTKEEARCILILATDIDRAILRKARKGVFSKSEIETVSESDRQIFFETTDDGYQIFPEVHDLVRFRELNLHAKWPMTGAFEAILCRNVLIYFDEAHQRALWPRFRESLVSDGYLYLGHSERICPIDRSGFASLGATVYQKSS